MAPLNFSKMINRQNTLETFINKREQEDITFCYLDIDDFTIYNNTKSYEEGNKLLQELSNILNFYNFIVDWYKINSDEFLLKCYGNFDENKKNLFLLLRVINESLKITVSIGATDIRLSDSKLIFSHLKNNLWVAKQYGKNKIYYK